MRGVLAIIVSIAILTLAACGGPTLPPATPGGGFLIETLYQVLPGPAVIAPSVNVAAVWQRDWDSTAAGDPSSFSVTTNGLGLASAAGKRAPAWWNFTWVSGGPNPLCSVAENNPFPIAVGKNDMAQLVCQYNPNAIQGSIGAVASPSTIYTQAPPASVSISGSGFTSQYGMPVLQYYALSGTLVAQMTASSVGANGNSIRASTPNLSQVATGLYVGIVQNVNANGSFSMAAIASINVVAPPGYITYVPQNNTCTPYEGGPISWTIFNSWVWTDAKGVIHNFGGAVSNYPGGACGGGPPSTFSITDSYGYTIHMTAPGGGSSYPTAYITGPGGTVYPPVEPL